jgi:hypothetical protein
VTVGDGAPPDPRSVTYSAVYVTCGRFAAASQMALAIRRGRQPARHAGEPAPAIRTAGSPGPHAAARGNGASMTCPGLPTVDGRSTWSWPCKINFSSVTAWCRRRNDSVDFEKGRYRKCMRASRVMTRATVACLLGLLLIGTSIVPVPPFGSGAAQVVCAIEVAATPPASGYSGDRAGVTELIGLTDSPAPNSADRPRVRVLGDTENRLCSESASVEGLGLT